MQYNMIDNKAFSIRERRQLKSINISDSILEYLLVALIIFDANSVYSASIVNDYRIPEATSIILLVLVIIKIMTGKIKLRILKRFIYFIVVYYPIMIMFFFNSVSGTKTLSFVANFFVVLPVLILLFCNYTQNNNLFRLFYKFVNVMTVLSVISLFFWLFGSQLHVISPTGTIYAQWGTVYAYPSYWGLYFERQSQSFFSYRLLRNQGIFCEAPMHSLCLVIAIAIEMFLPKEKVQQSRSMIADGQSSANHHLKKNNTKLIILIITLLTTITTTGQILLILMLLAKYVMFRQNDRLLRVIKILVGVAVIIAGLLLAYNIFLDKSESNSWRVRLDDFNTGFQAWLDSPIWGQGYNDITAFYKYIGSFRSTAGASNSVMTILGQGGAILFLVYVIPMVGSIIFFTKKKMINIFVFEIIFILEFVFTVFPYKFLMMFLLAFFYSVLFTKLEESKMRLESESLGELERKD